MIETAPTSKRVSQSIHATRPRAMASTSFRIRRPWRPGSNEARIRAVGSSSQRMSLGSQNQWFIVPADHRTHLEGDHLPLVSTWREGLAVTVEKSGDLIQHGHQGSCRLDLKLHVRTLEEGDAEFV